MKKLVIISSIIFLALVTSSSTNYDNDERKEPAMAKVTITGNDLLLSCSTQIGITVNGVPSSYVGYNSTGIYLFQLSTPGSGTICVDIQTTDCTEPLTIALPCVAAIWNNGDIINLSVRVTTGDDD